MLKAPTYSYFDREGIALAPGQTVTVQYCAGRYGKVRQITGVLKSIGAWHEVYVDTGKANEGNCIYPQFNLDPKLGERAMRGYNRFDDFEHGHETWIKVLS